MSDHREQAFRGWAKFLNPEVLCSNLITASVFLSAYEMLRASVIDRIRDFFSHEFRDGKWIASDDYTSKCLALDKCPLRASLLWLKQMSVIDDADIARVDQIREHRNDLAHDLPKFLATADAEINVQLLVSVYELVTKIDRWWIREVDMAIDPDLDGREVADKDIMSGNMLLIQMMLWIASGEDSAVFWKEFQKQAGAVLARDPSSAEPGAEADRPRE
jgi:hypothetical protein